MSGASDVQIFSKRPLILDGIVDFSAPESIRAIAARHQNTPIGQQRRVILAGIMQAVGCEETFKAHPGITKIPAHWRNFDLYY